MCCADSAEVAVIPRYGLSKNIRQNFLDFCAELCGLIWNGQAIYVEVCQFIPQRGPGAEPMKPHELNTFYYMVDNLAANFCLEMFKKVTKYQS